MENINLKPFPFCGGKARYINFGISCSNIKCELRIVFLGAIKNKDTLFDLWNEQIRADSPAPVQKLKNERNAGRKPKVSWRQVRDMCAEKRQGMTYRDIARLRGLSVATVHKLISEHTKHTKQVAQA